MGKACRASSSAAPTPQASPWSVKQVTVDELSRHNVYMVDVERKRSPHPGSAVQPIKKLDQSQRHRTSAIHLSNLEETVEISIVLDPGTEKGKATLPKAAKAMVNSMNFKLYNFWSWTCHESIHARIELVKSGGKTPCIHKAML